MSHPYGLSTVVARSYISEQLQDNMQKGSENRILYISNEQQKESRKKASVVSRTDKPENPIINKKRIKKEDNKNKKKGLPNNKKKSYQKYSKIDFMV